MSSDNQLNYGLDTDTIDIADSVIIDVATKTLGTIPGIHSLSPRFYDELVEGITHAFGQRSLPGINVKHRKGFIEINIYIKALYGYNLIELSKQLQSEIKQTLKNMLDLDHVKVDVHIEGIVKDKIEKNKYDQYKIDKYLVNDYSRKLNIKIGKIVKINGNIKTLDKIKELKQSTKLPFILKGLMTVDEAILAAEAGVDAIVVSNHGGRVLDCTPGAADVLPAIAEAVKGKVTILADGGVRSGVDVLKMIGLGADGVLIGRPFVTASFGGGKEGVEMYVNKIIDELEATMRLTGCQSVKDIDGKVIFR